METMLRTSERNLFKRCQWAWQREYQDCLKPKGSEAPALWFGTGIHLALEHWYKPGKDRGVDPVETWTDYCLKSQADSTFINTYEGGDFEKAVQAQELGEAMLREYVKEYGQEDHLEVISAEQTFQVGIPYTAITPDGTKDDKAKYVGTFDLVVRDHKKGKIYLWDHKTARALGSSNTQYLPLDDQAGSYWAVADYTLRKQGLIGKNEHIDGIVYNYLVKKMPDTRPKNAEGYATNKPLKKHYIQALSHLEIDKLDKKKVSELESIASEHGIEVYGEVSANQPSPMFERVTVYRSANQRRSQIERIQNDLAAMSVVRNGVLPATKSPTRECGFCPFNPICELDESGKDWTEMADMSYTNWDPYESHRKA